MILLHSCPAMTSARQVQRASSTFAMTSIGFPARIVVREICGRLNHAATRRGYRASVANRVAQNYAMPALSPTMTEGNIARWAVKEGDAFTAGDVLLEIETDKATMDVEAQDDGILVKITKDNGSKGVKVGERIAVTADSGDDVNQVEMPADTSTETASPTTSPNVDRSEQQKRDVPRQETSEEDGKDSKSSRGTNTDFTETSDASRTQPGSARQNNYPLYPSVEHILHQAGLSSTDAHNIPATGPLGRLLKGDVLAYLGRIDKGYPAQASSRLAKLAHLDLDNIEVATKPQKSPEITQTESTASVDTSESEIILPISLSAVLSTQKRVHDTLGIYLPLSTFIARASELANEALPIGSRSKPNADDLFNSVLGLDKVSGISRGKYHASIADLNTTRPLPRRGKDPDIIDMLSARRASGAKAKQAASTIESGEFRENVLSVFARAGEERRAAVYLERMKLALEEEPGRLVL